MSFLRHVTNWNYKNMTFFVRYAKQDEPERKLFRLILFCVPDKKSHIFKIVRPLRGGGEPHGHVEIIQARRAKGGKGNETARAREHRGET